MKKKFVISEQERSNILKMYGLITEQGLGSLERLITKKAASNLEKNLGRDAVEDLDRIMKNSFEDASGMMTRNLERTAAGELFIKSASGTKIAASDLETLITYIEKHPERADMLPRQLADGTEFRSKVKDVLEKRAKNVANLGGGAGSISSKVETAAEKQLEKFASAHNISGEQKEYLKLFTSEIDRLGAISLDQAFSYFQKQLEQKVERNISMMKVSQSEKSVARNEAKENVKWMLDFLKKHITWKNLKTVGKFVFFGILACKGVSVLKDFSTNWGEDSDYERVAGGFCQPSKYLPKKVQTQTPPPGGSDDTKKDDTKKDDTKKDANRDSNKKEKKSSDDDNKSTGDTDLTIDDF
jgi:hypothetical protein